MAISTASIAESKYQGAGVSASAQEIFQDGLMSARMLASSVGSEDQLSFARATIFEVVSAYWRELQAMSVCHWPLRKLPFDIGIASIPDDTKVLAETVGKAVAALDVMNASYMVGILYTRMMPSKFRAELGAYYTPPALCERLLDMATQAGIDWRTATSSRPCLWRRSISVTSGTAHDGQPERLQLPDWVKTHPTPVAWV